MMTLSELQIAVFAAEESVKIGKGIIDLCTKQNRDPTPEELDGFHASRKAAEARTLGTPVNPNISVSGSILDDASDANDAT